MSLVSTSQRPALFCEVFDRPLRAFGRQALEQLVMITWIFEHNLGSGTDLPAKLLNREVVECVLVAVGRQRDQFLLGCFGVTGGSALRLKPFLEKPLVEYPAYRQQVFRCLQDRHAKRT